MASDESLSREQLLEELRAARRRIAKLEASARPPTRAEEETFRSIFQPPIS